MNEAIYNLQYKNTKSEINTIQNKSSFHMFYIFETK